MFKNLKSETKTLEAEENEQKDSNSLASNGTANQTSSQNMTTPNDGSSAPAGFPDMQQNSTTPSPATPVVTGDESAADLEAEKKEIMEDEAAVEALKK